MSKKKVQVDIPQLSTNEKLEQIRSGKKLDRRKSRKLDIKDFLVFAKDGSKIIKQETSEKYEETAVKRKKRNYVMYESILGTEKNTEIKSVEKPKPKSVPRKPEPRREERIILVKKRKEYLDNYQYRETRVLKNTKPSIVHHWRLDSAPNLRDDKYMKNLNDAKNNTKINLQSTISTTGRGNQKIKIKNPSATATNFYRKTPLTIVNDKAPNKNSKIKIETRSKQIIPRRNRDNKEPKIYEDKTEVIQSNNSKKKSRPQTPYQSNTKIITKSTVMEKEENVPRTGIVVNTRSRRRIKDNSDIKAE